MKTKYMMIVGVIIVLLVTFSSFTFGQITWYSNGLGLSNRYAGKVTTDTLRFILGENSELTKDQTLTIDLSAFQIITSEVTNKANYDFSTSPSASSYTNFSMDTSDFSVSYNSTLKQVTFTLLTDNSLLPGDSTVLIISNVTANPGKSSGTNDVSVRVKSSDQPVFSRSEYDALIGANDQVIGSITFADTNASVTTYVTLYDTAEGIVPSDGIIKVYFPSGFDFVTSVDTSMVTVRDDGVKLLLSSVSTSGDTVIINLSATSDIEDGSVIQIDLGKSSSPMVVNPTIFVSSLSYPSLKSYSTGYNNDFYVAVYDSDGDTIFVDKSGGLTFNIASNWWADDVGDGGVSLSDYTASNPTSMTLNFKVGTRVDFDSTATTRYDTFVVDLTDGTNNTFTVSSSEAQTKTNYTFSVGFDDTSKFDIIYSSNQIKFIPDSAAGGYLPAQTSITLTISSNVLRNKGQTSDADVRIRTNHQTAWVTDRDVTAIDPNNGGVITVIDLADTNAGMGSVIDSLVFVANGQIPSDGQIRIKFPTTFTLATSIDCVRIDTGNTSHFWDITTTAGYISTVSQAAGTIVNNEVRLNLSLSSAINTGTTVKIMLGDTSGTGAVANGYGHISTPAFTNPAASDSGVYPTVGERSPFVVETRFNDGTLIMSGNNSDDPVTIVTNAFSDSQFVFVDGSDIYSRSRYAGDSTGIELTFKVGSRIRGARDTLYLDVSDFFVNPLEVTDTSNYVFTKGSSGNNAGYFAKTVGYDASNQIISFYGSPNDTLYSGREDSTIILKIKANGKVAGGTSNWGGVLSAKGARSDLSVRIKTNHQTGWITVDSVRTIVANNKDSASVVYISRSDSSAGETSYDTLWVHHRGVLVPGSKIAIKLDAGFSFSSSETFNTSSINLTGSSINKTSPSYSVTKVSSDSLVITLSSSDTLYTNIVTNDDVDTLKIGIGSSSYYLVNNVTPDSLSNYGRRRIYNGDSGNNATKAYKVYIYDDDNNLYQSNLEDYDTYGNYDDSLSIVTNFFTGGPILEKGEGATAATYDTAGGLVDTLIIPFKIGEPLVPSDWIEIHYSGITDDADSAGIASHYLFKGDTVGTSDQDFTLTVGDTLIRITLKSGDTLGAHTYQCTLFVANVFRNLGSSVGEKSTVDDIDLWIKTSAQSSRVQDTTNFVFTVPEYTPDYTSSPFGSTPTAGALLDYTSGYKNGTTHGYLPSDGIIDVYFPNLDDSSKGTHRFTFTVSDPDSAAGDVNGINSYLYTSTTNFMIVGASDTLGISYVLYDTLYSRDSSRFRIKLNGSGSNVDVDSSIVISIGDQIYAPKEATTGGGAGTANAPFTDTAPAIKDSLGFRIDLRDSRGYLISKGFFTTGQDIQPGTATKFLVLINGEIHDPGSSTGVRSVPAGDTVGTSIPVAILLVDQYNNIVTSGADASSNVTLSLPTNVYSVIDDQNGATDGYLTLSSGEGYYPSGNDSLTILTAGDGETSLGRGTPHTLTASQVGGSLTGTSNSFNVVPQSYAYILPFTFVTESYMPGDTANSGKSNGGNDELVGGATYTVTAYAVDRYYNRVDSTNLGQYGSISASQIVGSGVTIGTVPTTWDSDGTITFTIQPSTTGSATIRVTQGSYTGDYSFSIIAAVVKAIFETAPELSNLAGENIIITVDTLQFNGEFGTGEGFNLWAHTARGLTHISEGVGGALLASDIQRGENGSPYANYKDTVDSRAVYFQKDTRYYIYATVDALGDSVVGADTIGVLMRRYPMVKTSVRPITPNSSNQTLNSGGYSPQTTYDIEYKVVDYDDGVVNVKIYLSKNANLDTSSVGADGWLTEVQDTTILIKTLTSNDSSYTFNISDTLDESTVNPNNPYMIKGSYYVYINTVDDDGQKDVEKSSYRLIVRHSPSITLDRPVQGTTDIDTRDQKHLTINWSTSGVYDLDDEAEISLWYDTTTANHGTNVSALLSSSTAKQITSGFALLEHNPSPDTLQYDWDISAATSTLLPKDGGVYDFYALVRDSEDTIMAQSPGDVRFTHSPDFNFHFNLGGVLSKGESRAVRQVIINKGETFRFTWDGEDLDETQYVRLVVTQQDNYDYEALTFPDEATPANPTDAWIVNSSDGTQTNAVVVPITQGSYNWFSGNMTDLDTCDGDYYVFAFVTNNGSYSTWNNSTTDRFQAEGTFKLTGTEATTSADYDVQVVPGIVTTNKDDTIRFYVYLDSKGETIDQVQFNLKVDSTKFEVIDQDETADGIQPFTYESGYFFGGTGITLVEDSLDVATASSNGDTYYRLRFAKVDPAVNGGDVASDEIVASFLLKSRGTDSTSTVYSKMFFETEDVELSNDGIALNISIPSPAVQVYTNPLGRIRGRVPLQGRENFSKIITVELRPYGSLIPINSTAADYVSANDIQTDVNGVQVQTDRDGFFELTKVPTGTYDLVVKVDGWLSGQYRNISIVPGDLETGIDPTYDNSAIPVDRGELLAGDVSSGDAAGYPDNTIDEDDITYITSHYGEEATGSIAHADIDGSGYIDFGDLSWTSLNIGKSGVPPVYNKNAGGDNSLAYLKFEGIPEHVFKNQEFEVKILAKNVADMRGYTFTLCYDPNKLEIVNEYMAVEEGDFLTSGDNSNRSVFFTIQNKKGIEFVDVLIGSVKPAAGEGVIATVKMRSLVDDERPDISLVDIVLANSVNRFFKLKNVSQIPDEYGLSQNYPNPFNPETKIRFQLPMASKVVLKVYNVLGQEVRTLVNKEMKAGYHSIVWDGRNNYGVRVASGVYIYRIKAGKFVASKKMLFLK